MQAGVITSSQPAAAGVRSKDGKYVVEFLPFSSQWMVGGIDGKAFNDNEERDTLARAIMAGIAPVSPGEQSYSTCTDGRRRVKTEAGDGGESAPVPVREQLVGTDTMSAFVAAEALGERFYDRETELYASVTVRLNKVIDFMLANGLKPTAHIGCGAAGSFIGVISRAAQFINSADYTARLQAVMPHGTYDSVLHRFIVGGYKSRLDSNVYDGYADGLVTEMVREKAGPEAVEHYLNDGRGVNGHCEQAVVYLDERINGHAIDPNALSDKAGLQVFCVNAGRMDKLARLFSNGGADKMDYVTALIAIHDFAAAGHGTLANGMETLIVRPV